MPIRLPPNQGFVHLHNHTEYSFLDSIVKVKGLGQKLKAKGFTSYAITDHGNINGTFAFCEELKKHNIKPIVGCEFYYSPSRFRKGLTDEEKEQYGLDKLKGKERKERTKEVEKELGVNERYHIVVLAKNNAGFKKIMKAVELSHTEGFYRFPRIDYEILTGMVGDCIVLTACVGGYPGKNILNGDSYAAQNWCGNMKEVFGEDFYLEIQPNEMPEQVTVNEKLYQFSRELNIKLVATNDVHYLTQNDWEVHDTLLALRDSQHGKTVLVNDPDRFRYSTKQLYLKTKSEMIKSFDIFHKLPREVYMEALNNTLEIDSKIENDIIEFRKGVLPEVFTNGKDPDDYLMDLIRQGWAKRKINKKTSNQVGIVDWLDGEKAKELPLTQVYQERVFYEFNIIKKLGFTKYFLVIYDLIRWCRENKIRPGPGRGSVGGSLIAYLLGITAGDSIKWDCPFSRFITEDRTDYPDIDCFPPDSPVLTSEGWKFIKDIIPNKDIVATRHGWRLVEAKHFRPYKGKVIRLISKNGNSFTCTPNHRIIRSQLDGVQANEWKETDRALLLELSEGVFSTTRITEILLPGMQEDCYRKERQAGLFKEEGIKEFTKNYNKKNMQNLWKRIYNEISQSCLLQERVCGPFYKRKDTFFQQGLRAVWKRIQRDEESKVLWSLLRKAAHGGEFKEFVWEDWVQGGFRAFCEIFFRGRLCKTFNCDRDSLRIRNVQNFIREWGHLLSGFLFAGMGRICGTERMEGSRFRENFTYSKGDESKQLYSHITLSGYGDGHVRSSLDRWLADPWAGAGGEEVEAYENSKQKVRELWKGVQGTEEGKVLFKGLWEQYIEGKTVQWFQTWRKDGTPMWHMWDVDGSATLRKRQEILQLGMQKQIVCREETLTKEEEDYDGLVYNLTVEGEAEYNVAGIAVHNCDFPTSDRERVKQYLRDKYGNENVAGICTFGRMKGRQTLKDVARVFGVPHYEVDNITKYIIHRDQGEDGEYECIKDSINESPEFSNFADQYPRVIKFAIQLEGLCRQIGVHAAGVIATDKPVVELCPIQLQRKIGGHVGDMITGWDKTQVEKIGLLKLDILGIEALTYIQKCIDSIKERTGEIVEPEDWENYDSQDVWDAFQSGHTELVWQLNQPSAVRLLKQLKPDNIEHIIAANALLRPGPLNSGITAEYINRRHGEESPSLHEDLDRILSKTHGMMVFQEDTLKIAHDMAGFSWSEADKLRKAIGKKRIDKILELKEKFVNGFMKNGYEKSLGIKIFEQIQEFAKYGFNRSHSFFYSLLSYWTMYLKLHYPVDFICAALQTETSDAKRRSIIKEAKRLGINVLPPDVNISGENFTIDTDRESTIRCGFAGVKGVGQKTLEKIIENRSYENLEDFILRSGANKSVVLTLLRVGALDTLTDHPFAVEYYLEDLLKIRKSKKARESFKDLQTKIWTHKDIRYDDEQRDLYCLEYLALPPKIHLAARSKLEFEKVNNNINIVDISDFDEIFETEFSNNYEWFIGTVSEIKTYSDDFRGRQGQSARVLLSDESGEVQLSIPVDVLEAFSLDNLVQDKPLLILAKSQGINKLQAGYIEVVDTENNPTILDRFQSIKTDDYKALDFRRGKHKVCCYITGIKSWYYNNEENLSLCVIDHEMNSKELTVWSDVKRGYSSKFETGKMIECFVGFYKGKYSVTTNREKGGGPVKEISNAP